MMKSIAEVIMEVGKHMPRDRHQQGWVEETGKKICIKAKEDYHLEQFNIVLE